MFEKVNPSHPDKIADRIAGALVDLAYAIAKERNDEPKIAIEVLIGHGKCTIVSETSEHLPIQKVIEIAERIVEEKVEVEYREFKQDIHLANNQKGILRCGDNGIFKGVPLSLEEQRLTAIAKEIYSQFPSDGKYIYCINGHQEFDNIYVICQSKTSQNDKEILTKIIDKYTPNFKPCVKINPLGEWIGGINVDTGCTNRKLGSDMGDGVTGGGLHGKDFTKADVSCNIYAFIIAQKLHQEVELYCAIGDTDVSMFVNGKFKQYIPYNEIVSVAKDYINTLGGFEKFAEWGLINEI
jgi:S-adenosylmethionine synthetase